jgi:hypothetical protein
VTLGAGTVAAKRVKYFGNKEVRHRREAFSKLAVEML